MSCAIIGPPKGIKEPEPALRFFSFILLPEKININSFGRTEFTMKESDKLLYKTMKSLLNERLSEAEVNALKDEGFEIKSPKRKTAIVIALYKKAACGDLAAIKEMRSIVSEKNEEGRTGGKAVMIIDDIGN